MSIFPRSTQKGFQFSHSTVLRTAVRFDSTPTPNPKSAVRRAARLAASHIRVIRPNEGFDDENQSKIGSHLGVTQRTNEMLCEKKTFSKEFRTVTQTFHQLPGGPSPLLHHTTQNPDQLQ